MKLWQRWKRRVGALEPQPRVEDVSPKDYHPTPLAEFLGVPPEEVEAARKAPGDLERNLMLHNALGGAANAGQFRRALHTSVKGWAALLPDAEQVGEPRIDYGSGDYTLAIDWRGNADEALERLKDICRQLASQFGSSTECYVNTGSDQQFTLTIASQKMQDVVAAYNRLVEEMVAGSDIDAGTVTIELPKARHIG